MRGAADLPVLIVAGDLAVAIPALVADLADAVVDTGDAVADAARPAVPLAGRSVALLNRGTPGGVVTPDGALHMSLMRSCSAWPSGIWIDGDRRDAPDGSSFAWQHWSHTFEYALASGAGDWRAAGFSPLAEDYHHDLLAVAGAGPVGPVTPGPAGSSLSVKPATVTLGALKPRGNPLASGRARTAAGRDAEVTVRLRETSGQQATARVRLDGGPGTARIESARLTDLLEEADGAALPVEDGTVAVDLPAFGTVTVALRTSARDPGGTASAGTEPVQPVHARYWLHGKGPAPAGNLPVAVHFSPARAAVAEPGGETALTLTVGCGAEAATGSVDLVVPAGVTVTPGRDLRYDLAPGGYAAWDLPVRVPPGTAAGRYFIAARIRDGLGHLIEDTAMVAVGERLWPDPALPPEESVEVMMADYVAGTSEIGVDVLTPGVELAPGGEAELLVRVTSGLASELHGEAQLISPFGTWEMLGPWTQGFSLAPGAGTVLRFAVRAPAAARPGRWWALVKVMYYGRVRYTEAIGVVISPFN